MLWAEGPSPTHCHTLSPQSSTKAILGSLAGERCSLILEPDLPVKSFLPRDWTERARCPSATAQSFESLFGNSFWGGRPVSLRGDPAHTRSVGCLKNPVGMAEANPELGFSLTLTQQSSRMISPLASQTAVESKAAHRSQAPERDGTALLISQSRGEKKRKSVLDLLCQQCFKAQSSGRRRGGGSGGFTPSQGCHLGRSWWPFLASVPARGTALSSHLAGQPSKTQERRRQNRFTTKASKASITKIFSSLFLKGSQKSAFTEPALCGLETKPLPAAEAAQPDQAAHPRARL